MKVSRIVLLLALLVTLFSSDLQAQNRSFGAQTFVLDDGHGHTMTLQIPTLGANQAFTFPAASNVWPAANAAGVLTNDGLGNLSWSPSGGNYLPIAGGTMTGDINLGGHNITNGSAISATTFNGALVGNASTATSVSGVVGTANGGTGISSYTAGDLLAATGATTLSKLSVGANPNGNVLTLVGGAPAWAAPSIAGNLTGDVSSVGTATTITNLATTGNDIIAAIGSSNSGSIGYSKLNLAGSVLNSDLAGNIANGKLQNSTFSVTPGTGLSGGGSASLGSSTTLNLANTAVTPGSYTTANITVDQQGRITAASNGSSTSALASTHIFVGSAGGIATDVPLGGDLSIINSGAATVQSVGGSTATNVHAAELLANAATNLNTASTIVKRDASGNFTAGTITGAFNGNASTATSAGSFSGNLVGDVTGTQSATVVSTVGTSTAANVHAAELLANAATNLNTASTIVKRDASGNFTAGTITGGLNGNASTATTAGSFSGSLLGDVTGTQSATVVSTVGTSTAANVHTAEVAANAATSANTSSTIVKRDASGNFAAGTISSTTATGAVALNINTTTAAPATAISTNGGRLVYQSTTYNPPSAATIATNVSSVVVQDNGTPNSTASITLPAGTEGQVLFVTTNDPDGVTITTTVNTVLVNVTIDDSEVGTFMYLGGQWRLSR